MENIIIKPRDKEERDFFLELAKRLGSKVATIEDEVDERLFQAMERNKTTSRVSKKKVLDTLHQILKG
jgi:hypothetical protein